MDCILASNTSLDHLNRTVLRKGKGGGRALEVWAAYLLLRFQPAELGIWQSLFEDISREKVAHSTFLLVPNTKSLVKLGLR